MKGESLAFRSANVEDLPFLNRLMLEGKRHWGYPEEGLERFMKAFKLSKESFQEVEFGCVLEKESISLGYYLFKVEDNELKLEEFLLDTQHLGCGYGRIMWEHCIKQAHDQGWKEILFWADPNAQSFYEHMGAFKVGDREMLTLPGALAPIMKFILQ